MTTATRAAGLVQAVKHDRRRLDIWLLIGPTIAYLLVFSVFPLLYSLYLAFHELDKTENAFKWVGLTNFAEAFRDGDFLRSFINTIVFVVAAVVIEMIAGFALALFFNRKFFAKDLVRTLLILPMMMTPIAVGLMWRFMLSADFGMVNYAITLLGGIAINWVGEANTALLSVIIVDIWQWTPFCFLLLYAGLQAIPEETLEAGRVDGANSLQLLRCITIPIMKPIILLALLFRVIDSFKVFDIVYALTYGGPGRSSSTLSFYIFQNGLMYSRPGYGSALSYVVVVVVLILTNVFIRTLRSERRV
jgi:multiple sugar transport system permease protein